MNGTFASTKPKLARETTIYTLDFGHRAYVLGTRLSYIHFQLEQLLKHELVRVPRNTRRYDCFTYKVPRRPTWQHLRAILNV